MTTDAAAPCAVCNCRYDAHCGACLRCDYCQQWEPKEDRAGLWPYQQAGVDWIAAKKRVLVGDEVGLGKSVTALAAIARMDAYPALIVCPAFLRPMWIRMISAWVPLLNASRAIELCPLPSEHSPASPDLRRIIYLANYENLIVRQKKEPPEPGFTFDIGRDKKIKFLGPVGEYLRDKARLASIVLDESSYVKSGRAKRTKACKSIARKCEVRILLSATPVENGPRELISQLDILGRLEDFGGSWYVLQRYCDAKKTDWGYWDFSGSSHLPELHERLKASCFLRRTKAEVQQYLPAKRREVVPLPMENPAEYEQAEKDVIAWIAENNGLEAAGRAIRAEALVRISVLRQMAARAKLDAAVEWVKTLLEARDKVVLYVYHRKIAVEVMKRLAEIPVPNVLVITGETPPAERDKAVQAFQSDPSIPAIVVSIKAGGLGLDLTASSNAVFLETGWTPTDMEQAEGRLHRHGQTRPVTSWILLAQDSIEENIYWLVESKRKVVESVLEGGGGSPESVAVEVGRRIEKQKGARTA